MGTIIQVVLGVFAVPLSSLAWFLVLRDWLPWPAGLWVRVVLAGWANGCAAGVAVALIGHDWAFASGAGASLAVALAIRWWRKRRGRARAWLGAKSRALRDALVRRMPRPVVLRPVRGGA